MNPASTLTPQQRVEAWLADFEAALTVRDTDRATKKFATDSFWRDLVAFTWNIKTVEGRDGVGDMLTSRLAQADPSNFRTREDATEDAGVVSAFIEFDTAAGRGIGHLRLTGDEAWTLLTALQELKGHEQPEGPSRVLGAVHGSDPDTAKDPGPWEGEQRNMWKPIQQEDLWFHGGNLHQSRHYSLYLALQLKARYEGIPTPVYGMQEVHHLS